MFRDGMGVRMQELGVGFWSHEALDGLHEGVPAVLEASRDEVVEDFWFIV